MILMKVGGTVEEGGDKGLGLGVVMVVMAGG